MARTAVTVTTLTPDGSVADPAGTAADPTNGHVISGVPTEELFLEINSTFAGAKNWTVKAGSAAGGALDRGQGDLVVSINAAVRLLGPFKSARFAQADGALWLDCEAGSTGTVKAIRVPRTA